MIASSASSLIKGRCIPPQQRAEISLELPNGSVMYTWNKTAWLVDKLGKVLFELRSSNLLSSIAFNGVDSMAVGDSKGNIRLYKYSVANGLEERHFMEGQVLNTDIQKLIFCSKDILAVGGGMANQSCRQFMTMVRIVEATKEFKLICDGTGGPTKPVNDIACVNDMVAFASDDRSVTIFKIDAKAAIFYKAFSDYGGLVGRVRLSEDGQYIGYGSGGSNGKFLVRAIESESASEEHIVSHPTGRLYFDNGKILSEQYSNKVDGPKGIIKTIINKQGKLQAFDHVGSLVYSLSVDGIAGGTKAENEHYVAKADGRKITVLRRENGEPVRTTGWSSHDSVITSLVFLDDRKLVSAGLDGHVFVWSVDVPLRPVAGLAHAHHGPISNIATVNGGDIVTFGQEDGSIRFFKLAESA